VLRAIGLGLVVGAVLHGTAHAQQRDTARTQRGTLRGARDTAAVRRDTLPPPVPRDTAGAVRVPVPPGADSLLRGDSLDQRRAREPQVRDSVKAPIAAAEAPVLADPNGSFVWDRRDLFSTGALTVQDLLDRVPGTAPLRSGWIAHPMAAAYLGDPRRVRVWLDGLELEEMDPRANRVWDLTQIPLWALDDIRVERSASEIRIIMRSWRVDRTTPYTRTDVYTGDQGTNLYRGLFGRRYRHGEVVQLAGQQFGTSPGRSGQSSDALGALGRLGWAHGLWSVDAFLLRLDRNRGRILTLSSNDSIPGTESTRSEAYARLAWGRSAAGPWIQAIASTSRYAYGGRGETAAGNTTTVDTTRSRSQYVLAAGYTLGPLRASFTQRLSAGSSRRIATPSARVGFETLRLAVSAFAEGRGQDSTRRADVSASLRPVGFVFLGGSVGMEQLSDAPDSLSTPRFVRAEAGVRAGNVWLSGGIMRRDRVLLDAPLVLRGSSLSVVDEPADAIFAAVRGRLWKALYADFQGIQWSDTGGFYRPKYHTRSELYISTSMLERFPSGNLHILASITHEYRSSSLWPDNAGPIRLLGNRTLSSLIQIRVISAEVFWNFRNFLGERYAQVPGYRLPRLVNIYGVRWEFWN
jgi:hypothetical protein